MKQTSIGKSRMYLISGRKVNKTPVTVELSSTNSWRIPSRAANRPWNDSDWEVSLNL
nr:MAG TPA: hypothetical protein [Bacteriophage sp.]